MAEPSADSITSVPCHLSGITRLCFSPDGQTVFTGGSDCLVRIHKAEDPGSEPGFHDNHTDAITSLSCSRNHLVTASLDNIARVFSYPQNEFEGFITRSAGVPIRWVSLDPTGERVVVCGDDLLVKVVYVKETEKVILLSDHTKPVRSASWDPQGKYLVTSSCDGKLRIYDMTSEEPVLVRILDGVIPTTNSDSDTSSYVAWHPSGLNFAVATRTNEVALYIREGWSKQATFTADGPKQAVGELAWSSNGKYLASAAGSQISVWSRETQQIIAKYTNPEGAISGLGFSPKSNMLAFTSLDGSFCRWRGPIPDFLPDPNASEAAQAKRLDKLLDDFDDDNDDDEDMEEKGEEIGDAFGDNDDWIIDDDGTYAVDDGEKARGGRTEVVNVTKAQEPFAPGSTLMKNKKRYLAFSMIGVIDVTDQESHNVVNVEFHDKSARRGYHFQDLSKFTMASIGELGIVYGARSDGDQLSTIHYRPFDSWASQSDWTMQLLPGEEALCVAAGGGDGSLDNMATGSVIVATSKGYVRFLSSSGIQRYLWRIGEDVVTVSAGREHAMIVHREGGTSLDGCQNLRYSVVNLETFELIQEGRLPLPRKVTLTWIGFTAEGAPAMFDSTGLLSVLDRYKRSTQARWVPLLDTASLARREGRSESYWPVGVTGTHFACVILKGNEKEPWFPRPIIQEIVLRMPLLNMDDQQTKLEESAMRGELQLGLLQDSLVDNEDSEIEMSIKAQEVTLDKALLQMVQGACKADNLQRALDVTRLMHNTATIDAAAKVAGFYHLPGLQERIQGVKTDMDLKKMRERRVRRMQQANGEGSSHRKQSNGGNTASFGDFAPRQNRRAFGGVQRDTTPAASGRSETYIPETPGNEATPGPSAIREINGDVSPEGKRKREQEETQPDEFVVPKKKAEDIPLSNGDASGAKNPFMKKAAGSNPFAKPAVAKPLDAIKSTSFFERVDNIESSGVPKGVARTKKPKETPKTSGGLGKQTTLFGMKKVPNKSSLHQDSLSTETDEMMDSETQDEEESGPTVGILEESHVQETLSPESMEVA